MNNFLAILLMVSAGAALMYYLKTTDGNSGSKPASSPMPGAAKTVAKPAGGNVKAQHVAAITAAILTATQGRGRILSIVPQSGAAPISSGATRRWREVGIVAAVGRRIPPTWKR